MIPDINESFEDLNSPSNRSILVLTANKSLNFRVSYPIVWKGNFNGRSIELRQTEKHSMHITSFKFEVFPEEFEKYKEIVINYINACMKKKGA